MQLLVLGLNHKTAPVAVREKLNFTPEQIKIILRRLQISDNFAEAVLLSTCNRTELYLVLENPAKSFKIVEKLLQKMLGPVYKKTYFYTLTGINCARHLFVVAASLDSLVIGEGQILSQLKNAYILALGQGTTSTLLNTIFHRALAVGKRVRTETHIAYNSVSVSSAAVDLAQKVIADLTTSKVLIIGAGHMGELTLRHLKDKGARNIFVANRDPQKAARLAAKYQGTPVVYEHFWANVVDADIIITSTGATHYIITTSGLNKVLPKRQGKPLILIDIAVPRDVEPGVGTRKDVTLYNIDDLEEVVDENKNQRLQEAKTAEKIVQEEIAALKIRLRYLSMRPIMVQLNDKINLLRKSVLKHALTKMPELTEKERKLLDVMSRRLTHKFLRDPMTSMNKVAGTAEEEHYRQMVSALFLLDKEGEDKLGDEKKYDYWD